MIERERKKGREHLVCFGVVEKKSKKKSEDREKGKNTCMEEEKKRGEKKKHVDQKQNKEIKEK